MLLATVNKYLRQRQHQRQGLGFAAADYLQDDFYYGYGGDEGYASGGGSWQFDEYGDYYDPYSGWHVDQYGGMWNDGDAYTYTGADGQQYTYDPFTGQSDLLGFSEETSVFGAGHSINLSDLQNTLDWWQQLTGDDEIVELPNITYDAGYILNTPDSAILNDPQAPAVLKKPGVLSKIRQAITQQVKRAAQQAAGGSASGASGGASGAKPQTTAPKPEGTCQPGYAKHPATGQCTQIPPPKKDKDFWQTLKDNPIWIGLGMLALIMLAKK